VGASQVSLSPATGEPPNEKFWAFKLEGSKLLYVWTSPTVAGSASVYAARAAANGAYNSLGQIGTCTLEYVNARTYQRSADSLAAWCASALETTVSNTGDPDGANVFRIDSTGGAGWGGSNLTRAQAFAEIWSLLFPSS